MPTGVYIRTKPIWNKGKKYSFSKEKKDVLYATRRGLKTPEEVRKKISLSMKGKTNAKGCVRSENTKKKISIAFTRENHPLWRKDRSSLQRYSDSNKDRRSSQYRDWRKQVWLRDNYKCKIANPDCKGRIEVHHILGWTEHPELRYQINNGITLCHAHHPRMRAEEKRLAPFFNDLVSVSKE